MDWGESEQQGLALQACAMLPESRARLESDQTGQIDGCIMHTWQMQEAKSRLSEVLKDEERQGPLPIDAQVADRWGHLVAQADRSLPAIDSLLAATALTHGLTLVTRNRRDFQHPGLVVIDPWVEA